jgi:hypothetical protein
MREAVRMIMGSNLCILGINGGAVHDLGFESLSFWGQWWCSTWPWVRIFGGQWWWSFTYLIFIFEVILFYTISATK